MKNEEGRIVEGEDEVLEVMVRHWEELGRSNEDYREDDVILDTEMGDWEDVSWVCVMK